MPLKHLDARLFDKLLSGDVASITPAEARELAWHLMEVCPDCATAADVDWVVGGSEEQEVSQRLPNAGSIGLDSSKRRGTDRLDAMFDRVQRRVKDSLSRIQASVATAPEIVEELVRQPLARQKLLVHNDRRFQSLPVAELLLEKAWEAGFEKPGQAEELASVVLDIAGHLEASDFGEAVVNDVRARTWGLIGNFRRISGDFKSSREAFGTAWDRLSRGSGDLLERARLLTLEATLLRYLKQREQAAEMLKETISIYRALGETHLTGRTMINQALLLHEEGDAPGAIAVLKEAQGLLDVDREPRLLRVLQQNLVGNLAEVGRFEEAMAMIPSLRTRIIEAGTRVELLRLRWLEGQIHVGLGNEARAEAALVEVRRGMLDLELPKDVAVVSLELAALYMRQGRTGEIRELAGQMFPIFQSRDLHQEAIAALLLFQRAVEMDTLTLRMVEEVADVVRRSQEKPRPRTPEPS